MASVNTCSEDYMEYYLFPTFSETLSMAYVASVCDDYLTHAATQVTNFIWHQDPFNLAVHLTASDCSCELNASSSDKNRNQQEQFLPHFYGCTVFGDNIEDEWFIVWILRELTVRYNGLVVRVVDNDGEFLMIETADKLPKWINAESDRNRVYMYGGNVHVIPATCSPKDSTTNAINVFTAVNIIWELPTLSVCDRPVQEVINNRLADFPDKAKKSLHSTQVYLPAHIVAILNTYPGLISTAVRAFYLRDTLDLKACRAMKYFPPESCVKTVITLPRCQYSQLVGQNYKPDHRTGWKIYKATSKDYNAHDIGIKVACGFEIMASRNAPITKPSTDSNLVAEVRWERYVLSLKNKGYFRNELEGSKLYKELISQARKFYEESMLDSSVKSCMNIHQIMKKVNYDMEELKRKEKSLPESDSDDWLNVSPNELENLLKEKCHIQDNAITEESLSENLSKFLSKVSSYKGVETGGESHDAGDDNTGINFDPESFTQAMSKILELAIPDCGFGDESDNSLDYSDEDADGLEDLEVPKDANEIMEYMKQMDNELQSSTMAKSFVKSTAKEECSKLEDDSFDDAEDFQPVNVDMNVVGNLLASYQAQHGLPGPTSSLLASLPQTKGNTKRKETTL